MKVGKPAQKGYTAFVEKHKDKPIVLLELGVGFNTPMIIKYPFMRMADDNIDALYVLINMEKQTIPFEIQHNTIAFNDDILKVLNDLLS